MSRLGGYQMHGTASALGTTRFPAVQFRDKRPEIAALRQIVSMPAMGAVYIIVFLKISADTDSHSFLADAEMNRRLHFVFQIARFYSQLNPANTHHFKKQLM
jgi:hypothetical protein